MSEVEHVIRVTAQPDGEREPIVRDYTMAKALQAAYDWGRYDGGRTALKQPLYGENDGWSVVGVPLSKLREKYRDPEQG